MDFTAIDFETASERRDSACQLAAVRVRNGKMVDSACWLIRPEPFYFTDANIQIHGITPQQVQNELAFGDLWNEMAPWIRDDCLVAHCASFDISVLTECLRSHQKSIPELSFTCTRSVARRAWPGRKGYGLKPLSDWLDIPLKHHDALEDSIACAKILLAAANDHEVSSMEMLEDALSLSRGTAGDWGYQGPKAQRIKASKK